MGVGVGVGMGRGLQIYNIKPSYRLSLINSSEVDYSKVHSTLNGTSRCQETLNFLPRGF